MGDLKTASASLPSTVITLLLGCNFKPEEGPTRPGKLSNQGQRLEGGRRALTLNLPLPSGPAASSPSESPSSSRARAHDLPLDPTDTVTRQHSTKKSERGCARNSRTVLRLHLRILRTNIKPSCIDRDKKEDRSQKAVLTAPSRVTTQRRVSASSISGDHELSGDQVSPLLFFLRHPEHSLPNGTVSTRFMHHRSSCGDARVVFHRRHPLLP